ncbi:MAG TPA: hypothetical protein PLL75_02365 [Candidatus Omnitrophota bacterium]|nr:hypothetical protein [Candidatus Omnitrophota bacterium]HPS36556.1 hypothetical protein [Candidatus Omnitrophota bacterium]
MTTFSMITVFGFLLAIRGQKSALLARHRPDFFGVWREALDRFLTAGILLALYALALAFDATRPLARENGILFFGVFGYVLSRYQGKTDIFFLTAALLAFLVSQHSADLRQGLGEVFVIVAGIGGFQAALLGLRYRLFFSKVPASVRGWPVICLLASFVSLALWAIAARVF